MDRTSSPASILGALRAGFFPHQLSWLIDNPLRRFLINAAEFADRLPLTHKSHLLELGPGSGYFSVELARRVPEGRLELIDLQAAMLVKAARKWEGSVPANVGMTVADACGRLPFPAASFDLAIGVAVLGELPDLSAALSELRRVLKPNGGLAIHEHLPDPDLIRLPKFKAQLAEHGFVFQQHWGRSWNYTALFRAQASPSESSA